jgi:parallel beta-helix repeat protein
MLKRNEIVNLSPKYGQFFVEAQMKRHVVYITMFLVSLWLTTNALAAVYYVKQDGNDNLDGRSDATAWETIGKVNGFSFSTGDDIFFKCDDTWTEAQLTIDWAGTSGNYVTIGAYYGSGTIGVSGNKPIIDGNHTVPSNEYGALVWVNRDYVEVKNLRVINSEGRGVKAEGSSSNYISNCNLTNVETYNTYKNGIQYHYVDTGVAEGCEVDHAAMCYPEVTCRPWGGNFAIQNSNDITVRKCTIHEGYGEGIVISWKSHDNIIEDNLVYGNRAAQIYIGWGYNNIVRRNLCYGTTDTDFHRHTGFVGEGIGINDEAWHGVALTGNNSVYGNLVAFCKYGIHIGTAHVDSVFRDSEVYGNVFVDNDMNFFVTAGPWENSYIKNNISVCYSGNCTNYSGQSSTPGLTWDYNLWSSAVSGAATGANDVIGDPIFNKTSGWQSLTAGDLDGTEFSLQDTSPAINAGTPLDSEFGYAPDCDMSNWKTGNIKLISQDTQGSGWEIGADIYVVRKPVSAPSLRGLF